MKRMIRNVIVKEPSSPSAARLRSTQLKDRHRPEAPKPPPKYNIGELVRLKIRIKGTSNVRIVGREYGRENIKLGRTEQWFYLVNADDDTSFEATVIPESDISDRIS